MSNKPKEMDKSDYGPSGTAAGAQYQPHVNQGRKSNNLETVEGAGKNKNIKSYGSKPGQLSAKQQAAKENSKRRVKQLSSKPISLSPDQIAAISHTITPVSQIRKDEMMDTTSDGKQEIIEGREPLKKDPKKRWNLLKKALNHEKAFMDLDEAMGEDEEQPEEAPQQEQPQQGGDEQQVQQPEEGNQEEQPPEEASGEDTQKPLEAVSPGGEDDQEQPQEEENSQETGDVSADQQELAESLKEEGYSDQEIAYIVHGHHAAEVDPTKQAKASATSAMSDLDLDKASKMADLERTHAEQSMAAEREHKKRMSDLDYEQAQKKHALVDQDAEHKRRMSDVEYEQAQQTNPASLEQAHKQRMLDLEYEKAKKEASESDTAGDAQANKQMKQLEVEKKKLELKLREEEIKMELEFKKREHELKLKLMEVQIKEQGKQKSEISGIKHKQKVVDAKNPPAKKPLKKSEDEDDQDRDAEGA